MYREHVGVARLLLLASVLITKQFIRVYLWPFHEFTNKFSLLLRELRASSVSTSLSAKRANIKLTRKPFGRSRNTGCKNKTRIAGGGGESCTLHCRYPYVSLEKKDEYGSNEKRTQPRGLPGTFLRG